MYQLSQALASGTVKLMDWNSVVNAGMGGQIFQDALKETSELLGTGAEAAIKAEGSFRESLSTGWLTSEVLTETLKKFTTSGANEAVAKYTGLTTEAVEAALESAEAQYGEAEAIEYASKALAEKSGKSADEIKQTLQFAKTATDAATKVKTFTQLWDVMKESAQSGWSQTWKLLVGDFEQAKNLLTPLADFFTNAIGKMSDARNTLLEGALGQSFKGLVEKVRGIVDPIKNTADSIKEVTDSVLDYATVVDEIIGGKWGNGQQRWDKLAESGYDWAHAQNLVNEKLGDATRHATNYQEAQNGVSEAQAESAAAQGAMSDATIDLIAELTSLSDAQLKEMGYTEEQIKSFRDLADAADKTGIPIKDLLKNIDQIDGRYLLINSFKNIGQGLVAVFKAIGEAWKDAFPPMQSDQLFNIIAGFHKFTTYLTVDEETADKLTRTFKGLFAIIDMGATIIGGGVKFAFKLLTEILGYFNMDILDVTAGVGDAIVKFRDWFESITDVSQVLDIVVPLLKDGIAAIKEWLKSFKEIPGVEKFLDSIRSIVDLIGSKNFEFSGDGFTKIFDAVRTAFIRLREINLRDVGAYIFDGLIVGLADGAKSVVQKVLEVGRSLIEKFCNLLGIDSPSTVFIAIGGFIIAGLIAGIKEGLLTVPDAVKELVEKTVGVLQNIDWGTIFAIGVSLVAVNFVRKIGNALEAIASPFEGLGDIFESVSEVVESFGKVTKAVAFNIKMKALKQLALAILILAGAVVALSFIDPLKAWNAVAIVVVLAGVMAGLAYAIGKLSDASVSISKDGINMSGLRQSLISIGAAILLLGITVKLVGSMKLKDALQGVLGLVAVMGAMIGFIYLAQTITKKGVAEDIGKIGGLMITLSIAMALMIAVVKLASKLSEEELLKGSAFAAGFVGFVAAIASIQKKAGKGVKKIGTTMIALTIAIGLMIAVVKLVNTLDPGEMIKGALFASAFVLFIKGLVKAATIGKDTTIVKLGGMLLSVSVSMLLMVGVCKLISTLSVGEMLKGAVFAAAFVLFIKGLVSVLSVGNDVKMAKVAGIVLGLSVAIGVLAAVCIMLSLMSWEGLAKGLVGVGLLSGFVSLMIYATKDMPAGIFKNITALAIAIGVLAVAMAALSFIPIEKLAAGVSAMTILVGSFSLLLYSSKNIGKGMGTLIMLTLMIAEVAAIVWLLDKLDVQNAVTNAAALSLLLIATSAAMYILSKIVTSVGKATIGAIALTAMIIPIAAFIGALWLMDKVDNAIANADTISKLIIVMTGCLAALTVIGLAWPAAAAGLIALAAMVIPMLEFVGVLYLMDKVNNAITNAELLINLMTTMTDILVKLAIVGPLAVIGVAAMQGLTLVMVEIGLLAVAVGALVEKFPNLQKFIDIGMPLLEKISYGIGSILSNFTAGLTSGLPQIGSDLSKFMDEAQGFVEGIRSFGDDAVKTGVANLVDVITTLTTAEVITGIASFLSGGGLSFKQLGTDLSEFMNAAKDFVSGIGNFTPEVATAAESMGKTILMLTAADILSGIASFRDKLGGDDSMTRFAEQMKSYGMAVANFSAAVTEAGGIDSTAVEAAATAGMLMAELQNTISRSGSTVIKWFAGEKDLGVFGEQLSKYGKAIVKFSSEVSADGAINETAITAARDAGMLMVELQNMIANNGSTVVRWFSGEKDLATFGTQLINYGRALMTFSREISAEGAINEAAIKAAKNAGMLMTELQKSIEPTRGVMQWFNGTTSLDVFGEQMECYGYSLVRFSNALTSSGGINTEAVEAASTAGKLMATLQASLPEDGWFDGQQSLDSFGKQIAKFGGYLAEYANKTAEVNVTAVSNSVTAAQKLANLVNSLVTLDITGVEPFKHAIETLAAVQVSNIEKTFTVSLPRMTELGADVIEAIIKGMQSRQASLLNAAISIAQKAHQAMTAKIAIFNDTGVSLIEHMASGMKSRATEITTVVLTSLDTALTVAIAQVNSFRAAGVLLINNLIEGLTSRIDVIPTAMASSVRSAVSDIRMYHSNFYSAGGHLVDGFVAGISDSAWEAEAKAAAMAESALRAARQALGIHSPSREFFKIGEYTGQGFINALVEYSTKAYEASSDMATSAKDGMNNTIGKISDMISSGIDSNPTIKPVLDLSNIKTGISAMNGMLNAGSSVELLGRVNAISGSMNRTAQNGTNADVITAIDKLRGVIGNMSNTTYQVNGITYDDGSNITNAVSQLVRAAKIGRRV